MHGPVVPGGERETGVLVDRQRVHVRAQEDRRAGRVTFEHPDHRRQPASRRQPEPQPVQRLKHDRLRPRQLQPDLRDPVEPPPQVHDIWQQRRGRVEQFARHEGAEYRARASGHATDRARNRPSRRGPDARCSRRTSAVEARPRPGSSPSEERRSCWPRVTKRPWPRWLA